MSVSAVFSKTLKLIRWRRHRMERDWKRAFEESLKENDKALRILAKM